MVRPPFANKIERTRQCRTDFTKTRQAVQARIRAARTGREGSPRQRREARRRRLEARDRMNAEQAERSRTRGRRRRSANAISSSSACRSTSTRTTKAKAARTSTSAGSWRRACRITTPTRRATSSARRAVSEQPRRRGPGRPRRSEHRRRAHEPADAHRIGPRPRAERPRANIGQGPTTCRSPAAGCPPVRR